MDKRWLFVFIAVIFVSSACVVSSGLGRTVRGSGQVASETRAVSGFDEIDVCCGMQLLLTQGDAESLEVDADDNLLPEIVTEVRAGELVIHYRDSNGQTQYLPSQPVRVHVSAIQINKLVVSGGGGLEAGSLQADSLAMDLSGGSRARVEAVSADDLNVEVSGGGNLSVQDAQLIAMGLDLSGGSAASVDLLQAERLKLESSGGGAISIAGSAPRQDVSLSGGSSYQAGDLESENVKIQMSGGGNASLWVKETLEADLSGGARVEYYGRPRITEQLSGGSKLVALGER
jgi:hypothetical protein